jgi:hypothetical protein
VEARRVAADDLGRVVLGVDGHHDDPHVVGLAQVAVDLGEPRHRDRADVRAAGEAEEDQRHARAAGRLQEGPLAPAGVDEGVVSDALGVLEGRARQLGPRCQPDTEQVGADTGGAEERDGGDEAKAAVHGTHGSTGMEGGRSWSASPRTNRPPCGSGAQASAPMISKNAFTSSGSKWLPLCSWM